MLVVVENRNVANFFEATLDFKATRSCDVLEVDAAEAACEERNCLYDFVNIL